jgi:hypothetical protein
MTYKSLKRSHWKITKNKLILHKVFHFTSWDRKFPKLMLDHSIKPSFAKMNEMMWDWKAWHAWHWKWCVYRLATNVMWLIEFLKYHWFQFFYILKYLKYSKNFEFQFFEKKSKSNKIWSKLFQKTFKKKKKLPVSMKELAKFFLAWANQHPHWLIPSPFFKVRS